MGKQRWSLDAQVREKFAKNRNFLTLLPRVMTARDTSLRHAKEDASCRGLFFIFSANAGISETIHGTPNDKASFIINGSDSYNEGSIKILISKYS